VWVWLVTTVWAAARADPADAQPPPAPPPSVTASEWHGTINSNAFVGLNYQWRKFRDFHAWESQNWVMADLQRALRGGSFQLSSMFSFEPFTLKDIGSPQVFQMGETFGGAPLIDYQHPHDLVMQLGAAYHRTVAGLTLTGGADLVGSPTIGPAPFMHRPSGSDNPQAPLSHHHLDSTHITPGVIRAGIERGGWKAEGSWFKGQEPDETRTDLDIGALDSVAIRLSWSRGAWSTQASAAYLTLPEAVTPYDAKKLTASIAHAWTGPMGTLSWLAAFGQKREIHGNLEAYLLEGTFRSGGSHTIYARLESVAKGILDAGFHPRGTFHRHRQSQVSAMTVGYIRDVWRSRAGAVGIGGDVTGYLVPSNLREPYGSPVSFHGFMRYRFPGQTAADHIHAP
jgi:hypothetical protein